MSNLKIFGNHSPVVGVKEYYSINELFGDSVPKQNFLPEYQVASNDQVKWSVWIFERGYWRKTKENNKTGITVDYIFYQKSLAREAIKISVEVNGEKAIFDIKPLKASQAKIVHVDLLDVNLSKPTKPFAYGDWIVARVHCVGMDRFSLAVTLWEDDGDKTKQNTTNVRIQEKKGIVLNGKADVSFQLKPSFAWLANAKLAEGDTSEGEYHEYYVTAEFLERKSKRVPSLNTNVPNPDYKTEVVIKQTPAEKKGPSKKEVKGVNKSDNKVYDYHETKVVIKPTLEFNPVWEKINSLMKVNTDNNWWKKKEDKDVCVCKELDLIWGAHPNVSCEFRKKVIEISKRQNFDPNHLMAVMWAETSHTFSPSKVELRSTGELKKDGNSKVDYRGLTKEEILKLDESFSGAVGLIQFTPAAINGLNTNYGYSLTKRKLALMTQLEQFFYVEKYIAHWKKVNKITNKLTLADLYLLVFAPSKMNGSDDSTTLYKEGTEFYNANASIDTDSKNGITKKELAVRAYDSFKEGSKIENKETKFICERINSVESITDSGFYIYRNGDIKYINSTEEISYYVQVKEGSINFKKIETLSKNIYGLVKFPALGDGFGRYGGEDVGGKSKIEDVGKGDHYLLPQTAAALFGVISDAIDKKWQIDFGDMSSENGSDPTSNPSNAKSHHSGHGHKGKQSGLNIDFRYLNKNGKSFRGNTSSIIFDDNKNEELFKIGFKYGFDKNYATDKNYVGVNPKVGKHYDHGHFGTLSIDYEIVDEINAKIIN
ncbi:hypothetical protein [Flavobacterium sp. KMS]|uniref:hypothetical protein n=1 Tax=Flavobacterium sp. KMS TaxID=1566023 RepID=UPI00068AB8B6|nr:hypothetical protein [Flavobacterium sp. KMS]